MVPLLMRQTATQYIELIFYYEVKIATVVLGRYREWGAGPTDTTRRLGVTMRAKGLVILKGCAIDGVLDNGIASIISDYFHDC